MVKQIKIDNNNVVELCSIGGIIEGGIDVEDIPDKVMLCPSKWKFENGKYTENEDYKEPQLDINSVKERKIEESKAQLAEWLENHPMAYTDGKAYAVTAEKQSLLNGNLASYERAKAAGIDYPLKWNSTGEECTEWSYEDLVALSLTIAAYVSPKVAIQQELEIAIKACKTAEELAKVVISYD